MSLSIASLVLSACLSGAEERSSFQSVGPKKCRGSELPLGAPGISLYEEVNLTDTSRHHSQLQEGPWNLSSRLCQNTEKINGYIHHIVAIDQIEHPGSLWSPSEPGVDSVEKTEAP